MTLLIALLIVVLIAAVLVGAVQRFMPGDAMLKNIVCLIIIVIAIAWVLMRVGLPV